MWQEMMNDIRNAKYKWQDIGEKLGISKGAAHDLWTGRSAQPTGNVALRLIALHKSVKAKNRSKKS